MKKLSINKEVIVQLGGWEMTRIKGGRSDGTVCEDAQTDGGRCGGGTASCFETCVATCIICNTYETECGQETCQTCGFTCETCTTCQTCGPTCGLCPTGTCGCVVESIDQEGQNTNYDPNYINCDQYACR